MNKRNLLMGVSALVVVLGVILLPKYLEYRNTLKQEVEDVIPVQNKPLFENISLPPPPATTSTAVKTIKLPKPLSPQEQQKAIKKITLPPPSAQ